MKKIRITKTMLKEASKVMGTNIRDTITGVEGIVVAIGWEYPDKSKWYTLAFKDADGEDHESVINSGVSKFIENTPAQEHVTVVDETHLVMGTEYKDVILSTKGVLTRVGLFFNGCIRGLLSYKDSKGISVSHWIDEQRLIPVSKITKASEKSRKRVIAQPSGGPRNMFEIQITMPPCWYVK